MSQLIIDTNDITSKTTLKELLLLSYIKNRLTNVPLYHISFKDIMSHVNIGFTPATIKNSAKKITQYEIDIKKDELIIHNEIQSVNVIIQKENKKSKKQEKEYSEEIIDITNHVIEFLNQITNLNYRKKIYYKDIQKAINLGYNQENLITIIANKYNEWFGTDMAKYLTQNTLFKEDHLDKYLNMAIDYNDKTKKLIKNFDNNNYDKKTNSNNKETLSKF